MISTRRPPASSARTRKVGSEAKKRGVGWARFTRPRVTVLIGNRASGWVRFLRDSAKGSGLEEIDFGWVRRAPWLCLASILHGLPLWAVQAESISAPPEPRKTEPVWITMLERTTQPGTPQTAVDAAVDEAPPRPRPVKRSRRTLRRSRPKRVPPQRSKPNVERAPVESSPAPRRIVGLSMGSTVQTGPGGAYVTGQTLDGQTEVGARPARTDETPRRNHRRVRSVPRGPNVVRPKRLHTVEPEYPDELRSLGLEAEVVVQLKLTASGEVSGVRILRPASHPAFNESALRAARMESFSPARRDGTPIEYTLSFTYRFRIRG